MALREDEREDLRVKFLEEVEEELRLRARRDNRHETLDREAVEREAEVAKLRSEVREAYWRDNGYVKYIDSQGRDSWVSADEAARRKRRRSGSAPARIWADYSRRLGLFMGLVVLATLLGLAVGARR